MPMCHIFCHNFLQRNNLSFLGIVVHAGDFDNFNVVNQELNWIETNTLVNKVRLKLQYCSKYITYSIYST